MREVVIVEAVRSPMGRRGGVLSGIHPNNLGAMVLNEVVKRAGIESGMVEDVVFGCVDQVGEQGANVARNVLLTADFPYTVAGDDRRPPVRQRPAGHPLRCEPDPGRRRATSRSAAASRRCPACPLGVNITQGPGFPFHAGARWPSTP